MKRILLASVAALGLAGTASAADLAVQAPAVVPLFTWTGCYLGINGGWIGGNDDYTTSRRIAPAFGSIADGAAAAAAVNLAHSFVQRRWLGRNRWRPVRLSISVGLVRARRRMGRELERPERRQLLLVSGPHRPGDRLHLRLAERVDHQAARLVLDRSRSPRRRVVGSRAGLRNGRFGAWRARLLPARRFPGGRRSAISSAPIARSASVGPPAAASNGRSPRTGPPRPSSSISTSARSTISRRAARSAPGRRRTDGRTWNTSIDAKEYVARVGINYLFHLGPAVGPVVARY